MSEVERCKGKLKLIESFNSELYDDYYKRILLRDFTKDELQEELECYGSYEDIIFDCFTDKYAMCNGKVYELLKYEQIDPFDSSYNIQEIDKNTYEFDFTFHNGGTYFEEVLSDSLNTLNEENN